MVLDLPIWSDSDRISLAIGDEELPAKLEKDYDADEKNVRMIFIDFNDKSWIDLLDLVMHSGI